MRIMVISRHRTRSSFLTNALSRFYGLTDKAQVMDRPLGRITNLNRTFDQDLYYQVFLKNFKSCMETQFGHNNFSMKLFPSMLILSDSNIIDLSQYKLKIIQNLTYYANIKKFDKIFFLDRDIVQSYMSYAYAYSVSKWNVENTLSLTNEPIMIDINHPHFKFYLYCSALQSKILEYLNENDISYTNLNYDEAVSYVSENLKIEKTRTIDMHNDYKNLIINHDDLIPQIQQFYYECMKSIKDFKFI